MKAFRTLLAVALCVTTTSSFAGGLVVHEGGTFTSVQGGDGKLQPWNAQQVGDLPEFVYDWFKPGLNRQTPMNLMFGKGGITGLQRMETPVIYFYSGRELELDVEVKFPNGTITEWFPQAAQIGPCTPVIGARASAKEHSSKENLVRWNNVRVLPTKANTKVAKQFPTSKKGVHYFAARETEADPIRVNNLAAKAADEHERFLFYRGTGNFGTPLVVTTADDGMVSIQNTGTQPIPNLFLLHVKNGTAQWARLDGLNPGKRQGWQRVDLDGTGKRLASDELKKQLGDAMTEALTGQGLFPPEAKAMVKTWSSAWFTEEGLRVLYILPREWTDEILPLKLSEQPCELERVMVGRAEIITPDLQKEIAAQLRLVQSGNSAAQERISQYYKKLGRFAGPAVQLAKEFNERGENKPVATAAVK